MYLGLFSTFTAAAAVATSVTTASAALKVSIEAAWCEYRSSLAPSQQLQQHQQQQKQQHRPQHRKQQLRIGRANPEV